MSAANGPSVLLVGAQVRGDRASTMARFARIFQEGMASRRVSVEFLPSPVFWGSKSGAEGEGISFGEMIVSFLDFPRKLRARAARARVSRRPWVAHIADQTHAFYTRALSALPVVVTCHDLLAARAALGEFHEVRPTRLEKFFQRMVLAGLRRASCVACVSETTAGDVRRLAGIGRERVCVIPIGLNHPYRPMERDEARARAAALLPAGWSRAGRLLLHVGHSGWYKNRAGAIRILAELGRRDSTADWRLVMVGRPPTAELDILAREIGVADRIASLVNVADEDLRGLYCAADALLFPSLAEGFGWPIIEAQSCGCPVITSARAPMTEVAGDAALFVDPADPAGAAGAIMEGWAELGRLRALGPENARRFSTEAMLDRYAELYARLANVP
ncbi:MAG TPA: glycosyltransferase family 1 protein [Verrucomicrobiae bacterium]|nr:glycosyltransferase family 1 protein [Verrucomicrobiae bacterium]